MADSAVASPELISTRRLMFMSCPRSVDYLPERPSSPNKYIRYPRHKQGKKVRHARRASTISIELDAIIEVQKADTSLSRKIDQ